MSTSSSSEQSADGAAPYRPRRSLESDWDSARNLPSAQREPADQVSAPLPEAQHSNEAAGTPPSLGKRRAAPSHDQVYGRNPSSSNSSIDKKPPAKKKRRIRILLAAVLVIALLLGGYIAFNQFSHERNEKAREDAVIGLLNALKSGNATEALSFLEYAQDPGTEDPLLTDKAISQNPELFTFNPTLVGTAEGKDYRYDVSIQIGDTAKVVTWTVHKIRSEWKVNSSDVMGQIKLADNQKASLNGIDIGPGPSSLSALPGRYTLSTDLPLLADSSETPAIDVFNGSEQSINESFKLADTVKADVIAQVRSILAVCAADSSAPGNCNWGLKFTNGSAKSGSITWKLIPEDPATTIELPAQGWSADKGYAQTISLEYQTSASGQGIMDDGTEATFKDYVHKRTSDFSVDLSGSKPKVTLVS